MLPVEGPELLALDGNLAVIQMPGRRFPGLLVQGDTLASIRHVLDSVEGPSTLPSEIQELRSRLDELLSFYELVLLERGTRLPY